MFYVALKVGLTAILVVAINEIGKRSPSIGGVVASLPLTSLLAFIWIYGETYDTAKIAALSRSIFWYVIPSLVLFVALPMLLDRGFGFWPSLAASSVLTFGAYTVMTLALGRFFGITL